MTSFNFNGVDSASFPWLLVNRVTGSLLPSLKRRYITVPGREGAYHAGRDMDIRVERIKITVLADSQEELAEKKRILAEWLDTEQTAPFFYSYEPDKVYQAVLSGETDLEKIVTDGETELIFEMPDPYATSTDTRTARLRGASVGARYEDFTGVGTQNDVVGDEEGLRLAKEGQDLSDEIDWTQGSHNDTEANSNGLRLKQGMSFERVWPDEVDWDDPENTRNGAGNVSNYLTLSNTPDWNLVEHFLDYTDLWRRVPSSGGGGTVTQEDNFVRISGTTTANLGIDIQDDPNIVVRFPATVLLKYRNQGPDAGRLALEDGGSGRYIIELDDISGEWVYLWLAISNDTCTVYKNGELVGAIASTGASTVNQIQIYIPTGRTATLDVDFMYIDWDFDKGAPPAGNEWVGTWETPYMDLSGVGIAKNFYIDWIYWFAAANFEYEGDILIEYQLRVNGVEQGWQTILDDVSDEGPNSATIGDLPRDLTSTEIKIRVALRSRDPASSPVLEALGLHADSGYPSSGYWESPIIADIQQVGKAAKSMVSWAAMQPAGTSATLYARFRASAEDDWGSWVELEEDGQPFPGISQTTDLTAAEIQFRIELSTTDAAITPYVETLEYEFLTGYKPTGQWVSPEIPLEDANVVGDSFVSFTWNGVQGILLEVRVNGGSWQQIENGKEIPGVRGTEGAVVEVRLTLSTTDTSETPVIDSLEVTAKEAIDSFIEYGGTAPGYPVFYIDVIDELNSLQILHVESGRYVLLEGNFQPGDEIVVDHNDQSITLNGVYRLDMLNIKARFFRLQKGTNSFEVSPQYGAIISMEWAERWK